MSHNNHMKEQNMQNLSKKDEIKMKAQDFMTEKVVKVDEEDQQFWNMLVNVPQTHKALAVICLLVNILLPGFGTMFAACGGYSNTVSKTQLAVGMC